jgi:hypothetical protein
MEIQHLKPIRKERSDQDKEGNLRQERPRFRVREKKFEIIIIKNNKKIEINQLKMNKIKYIQNTLTSDQAK